MPRRSMIFTFYYGTILIVLITTMSTRIERRKRTIVSVGIIRV
jgi:hypothetical protein